MDVGSVHFCDNHKQTQYLAIRDYGKHFLLFKPLFGPRHDVDLGDTLESEWDKSSVTGINTKMQCSCGWFVLSISPHTAAIASTERYYHIYNITR